MLRAPRGYGEQGNLLFLLLGARGDKQVFKRLGIKVHSGEQ